MEAQAELVLNAFFANSNSAEVSRRHQDELEESSDFVASCNPYSKLSFSAINEASIIFVDAPTVVQ